MVSIILVNYNTRQMTDDCIRSIIEKTKTEDYEIILVDNASTDGSKEYFQNDSRLTKYLWLNENIGFGRANNEGIKIAKGEYLFLLNTDTIFLNDVLECFVNAAHYLKEESFVLGGWLVDGSGKNTASTGEFSSMKDELQRALTVYTSRLLKRKNTTNFDKDKYITPVELVIGADMFMSQAVVEKSGMFDPAFFMYCEEMDWQYRMSLLGIPRYIVNTPKIVHLVGGSQGSANNKKKMGRTLRITRSMFIYLRKYNNGVLVSIFKYLYFLLRFLPVLFVKDYSFDDKKNYLRLLITEK